MPRQSEIIVALDIGTTKVCALVGEVNESGMIDITGFGSAPSNGLRRGVVVDINSTVTAIRQAIQEAERMTGCQINDVYVGIAGGHIQGQKSDGQVTLKGKVVRDADVDRVIQQSKIIKMPEDREIIHVIPQEYIVDDQDGIKVPQGMCGLRMKTNVYIVTGATTAIANIKNCCQSSGLNIEDVVLEQLASSYSVLSKDEKELGVALVDIGGGTTDLAIWANDSLVYTSVIDVAGSHITKDIGTGMSTPLCEAEKLKTKYGKAMSSLANPDNMIEVPIVGGREPKQMTERFMSEIIEPRVEEILSMVKNEIIKSGYEKMIPSGLVLTGGTSMLPGIDQMAASILDMPTRIGYPAKVGGLADVVNNPMYSTAVGILLYSLENGGGHYIKVGNGQSGSLGDQIKSWFKDLF